MKRIIIDAERCKSCGLCVSVCPKKLIGISPDKMNEKGCRPAEFTDNGECVGCGACFLMCPDTAITMEET